MYVRHSLRTLLLASAVLLPAAPWAATEEKEPVQIGYYALSPSIVSNLTGGPRYIRCDIQLMTEQATELPKIELHAPALRHAILMLIAGEDGKRLMTRDGKEGFRKKALETVQEQLRQMTGESIVSDLYFTNYFVK